MAILFPQLKEPVFVFTLLAIIICVLWCLKLPVKSLFTMLMFLIIAFAYYQWFDHRNVSQINESYNDVTAEINGRVTSAITVDGDHVGFVLSISHLQVLDDSTNHGVEPFEIKESVQVSMRLLTQEDQAAVLAWQRGDDIHFSGKLQLPSGARNFGGFDYRRYLKQQHIHWMIIIKGLDSVTIDSSFHWNLLQLLRYNDQFRGFLAAKLDLLFPESQAGYMISLLIGLRVDLDPQQFQQFSNLGLTHILAISGMQVAVFCAVVLWILRKLRFTKETGLLITITLLPFYVLFTGSSPSVVRAGLMGMIALYAARRNWLKDGLKLLCLVGWLMLIWNPYALLDVSFQLSFAVTYGLIVGVPWISQLLPKQKTINSTLAVTLVAQMVSG
jgi:competence protein ComEC